VAKRDGDRDHVRPLLARHAIEIAHELREEVVGEQFRDDQLQERARPCELRGTGGEQPHGIRTKLRPPPLGIELLFRSCGVFELTIDVEEQVTERAHGCTSGEEGQALTRGGKWAGVWPCPRA
jgi:hypothetical protein